MRPIPAPIKLPLPWRKASAVPRRNILPATRPEPTGTRDSAIARRFAGALKLCRFHRAFPLHRRRCPGQTRRVTCCPCDVDDRALPNHASAAFCRCTRTLGRPYAYWTWPHAAVNLDRTWVTGCACRSSQTPPEHPPDTQQTSCSRRGAVQRAARLAVRRGLPPGPVAGIVHGQPDRCRRRRGFIMQSRDGRQSARGDRASRSFTGDRRMAAARERGTASANAGGIERFRTC